MIASWGGGYVTDVPYVPGIYAHQSVSHLHAACVQLGIHPPDIAPDRRAHVLELGCGYGLGLATQAASQPQWLFTGVDFAPAHIAAATSLAADVGLPNLQFLEADLVNLAQTAQINDIPDADIITLHGVWSWVSPSVRDGIVQLIKARLRPGGLVQVSYNALPNWQNALGLQRLIQRAGQDAAGRSDARALAGLDLARQLHATQAVGLDSPYVQAMLEKLETVSSAYLAHEYMNTSWAPCFHADLLAQLAQAKLEWIGSTDLTENAPDLCFTPVQRAIYDSMPDPSLKELIKDLCLTRGLRSDIFVRGARPFSASAREAALAKLRLAPVAAASAFQTQVNAPAGRIELSAEVYKPVIEILEQGWPNLGQVCAQTHTAETPTALLTYLVGSGQAVPVWNTAEPAEDHVARMNSEAFRRFARPSQLTSPFALATSGAGSVLPCTMLQAYVYHWLKAGHDPSQADHLVGVLAKGGDKNLTQDDLRAQVQHTILHIRPVWQTFGLM